MNLWIINDYTGYKEFLGENFESIASVKEWILEYFNKHSYTAIDRCLQVSDKVDIFYTICEDNNKQLISKLHFQLNCNKEFLYEFQHGWF